MISIQPVVFPGNDDALDITLKDLVFIEWFDMHPLGELTMPPYLPTDQDDIPQISRDLHEVPMMPTTDWAIESPESATANET